MLLLLPHLLFGDNSRQSVFTNIYDAKLWGCNEQGEGCSGSGSRMDQTDQYRLFLQRFLKKNQIQSVVDLGCGDWSFSQQIDWSGVNYSGFDVVESVIEKNKKKFISPNIHFQVADGCFTDLPNADLFLCKDVLQHLSNKDVQVLLEKLKKY